MSDDNARKRMAVASHLLPDPGGEVVRDLLRRLDEKDTEIAALREAVRLLDAMVATMIRQFDRERLCYVLYETSLAAIRLRPEVQRALKEEPKP